MRASAYQKAIYEWVLFGEGNAAVNAVAGSGKTTTLVECAGLIDDPTDVLFLAFNKSIVEELRKRLPRRSAVQTLNSLGHRALSRHISVPLEVDSHKYDDIIQKLLEGEAFGRVRRDVFGTTKKSIKGLVSYAQSTLCERDDDSLEQLADFFDVEIDIAGVNNSLLYGCTREALIIGEREASKGIVSYDDQIWLPVLWGLRPGNARFIFIDECQDLSRAKLELVLATRADNGRLLFVGDRRQSIYGFAGADSESFDRIVERTEAEVLPLSISYRCAKSIVAAAQRIVKEIEPAENAIEGTVGSVLVGELHQVLQPSDLVLCRLTAPLVGLCIRLMKNKVTAHVRGRDIGRQLVDLAGEALHDGPWNKFGDLLTAYHMDKREHLSQRKHPENALQSLADRVEGVRVCYETFRSPDFETFKGEVASLFSDDKAGVDLSTIHRAKGLEADRVFILAPEKLPLTWEGQRDWQFRQEMNLKYVAVTRAKSALYIIGSAGVSDYKQPQAMPLLLDVVVKEEKTPEPETETQYADLLCEDCGDPCAAKLISTNEGIYRVALCHVCYGALV
jgi:superfamily I DNA/RNA helicase